MGAGNSQYHQPLPLQPQPPYHLDVNALLEAVPKMMRVADDMHRMTDYMMDLRNLTILMTIVGAISTICYLIFKYTRYRSRKNRGRYQQSLQCASTIREPFTKQWVEKDRGEHLHKVVVQPNQQLSSPDLDHVDTAA